MLYDQQQSRMAIVCGRCKRVLFLLVLLVGGGDVGGLTCGRTTPYQAKTRLSSTRAGWCRRMESEAGGNTQI